MSREVMGGGGLAGTPAAEVALVEELLVKGLEKLNRLLEPEEPEVETVEAGLAWFWAWICLTVTPAPLFFELAADTADDVPSDFLRLNFIVLMLFDDIPRYQ